MDVSVIACGSFIRATSSLVNHHEGSSARLCVYGPIIYVNGRLHKRQNFEKFRNSKIYYHSIKELSIFLYITHRKLIPLSRKWYQFSVRTVIQKDT